MISQQKNSLRELQLAFVGKLMAGLSHDFKNHLAIIKELSGLIQDLLLLEEQGQATGRERYERIIAGINERIGEAAEMCRFLSGFAHRMDQPLSSFSVPEVLQEEISLLGRFARQKQVKLISSFEKDRAVIFNNPSLLQFVIFCIVWPALELLKEDSRIELKTVQQKSAVQIMVKTEGERKTPEGASTYKEALQKALPVLRAEHVHTINQDGTEEIVISVSSLGNLQPADQ